MALIIKKKVCLFIILLINLMSSLYGMKRSVSLPDMKSLQSNFGQNSKFPGGKVEVILLDKGGSPIIGFQIEDPQLKFLSVKNKQDLPLVKEQIGCLPEKTQKDLNRHFKQRIRDREWAKQPTRLRKSQRNKNQDDDRYLFIYPKELSSELFLLRTLKNILNNQIVIDFFRQGAPAELIKFLPRYSLENKEVKRLKEELLFQKRRKEEAMRELENQRESLKKNPKYLKQIALLKGCFADNINL